MNEPNWTPEMRERGSVAPAGRPMPHAAVYQGWLGATVNELAETTEADPIAILATLIGAYSVMIGNGPRIAIHDNRAPLLVWPLILGRTSVGRKGMSYNVVKRLVRDADLEFYSECVTSGLSSGEGLIDAVMDEVDEEQQGPPPGGRQVLVVETEYANTMNRAGREGNTLSGVLRQAWDGDSLRVMTRSHRLATHPHIGIVAHITPGEFRMKVKSADMAGGSYNRFLPIFSERLHEIPYGEGADPARVAALARELAELVQLARLAGKVGLTPAALDHWRTVYSVLSASPAHDGTVAQFTARAPEYCRRLAAVYALADGKAIADREHLEAAYQLVNYSRATAAHVMGDGTGDPVLDKVVAALISAGDDGLKRSDITQKVLGGRKRPEIIADLFDKLNALPYIGRESHPGKGRTAEVWVYRTEEAEEAEEALRPAPTSSARPAEEAREKGGGDRAVDFLRTSSALGAELERAGQRAFSASSASSAPESVDDRERIEV